MSDPSATVDTAATGPTSEAGCSSSTAAAGAASIVDTAGSVSEDTGGRTSTTVGTSVATLSTSAAATMTTFSAGATAADTSTGSSTATVACSTVPTCNNETVQLLKSIGDVLVSFSGAESDLSGEPQSPLEVTTTTEASTSKKGNGKDKEGNKRVPAADLVIKFDGRNHEVTFVLKNGGTLENFAESILRRVTHQLQLEVTYAFIRNLPEDVKSSVRQFLAEFTNANDAEGQILNVHHTNMAQIWEAFLKCTTLIKARVNTSKYASDYEACWKRYLLAAEVNCTVTVEAKSTKFNLKPLLTYTYDVENGIFPLSGDCFHLGAIFRNAVAHNQIIGYEKELRTFSMLYPALMAYEPLMGETSGANGNKKFKRRLWLNVHENGEVDVVLADRGKVTEWLVKRYNSIAGALGAKFTFEANKKSM